ncbi:MAG: MFS transporter [Desulfurococcales archaeon]|nr:MFS transporter [Desulfurococcales archaeon]
MKLTGKLQLPMVTIGFLLGIVGGISWATMAPYLRGLGFTGKMYGLYGGLNVLTLAVVTFIAGPLSDRYGGRIVSLVGVIFSGIGFIILSQGTVSLIYTAALINGIGGGLLYTGVTVLLSRTGLDKDMHYRFSYFSASQTLGGGIGSFLGWAPVYASRIMGLSLVEAYEDTFFILGILTILSFPLPLTVREERLEGGGKGFFSGFHGLGAFWWIAIVNALIGFAAAMSIHNIDYYFTVKYNVNSGLLGSVFGVQQLIMAFIMVAMPHISDRVGGPLKLYLVVSYSSIPLLVLITLTNNYTLASSFFITRSILMNVANPLFQSFSLSLVPFEKRGVASSLMSLSWTLPAGFGRMVGGYLFDINLELPLRLTAGIYTISLSILAILFYPSKRASERINGIKNNTKSPKVLG